MDDDEIDDLVNQLTYSFNDLSVPAEVIH